MQIDKDIPREGYIAGRKLKYPFPDMEVNDSFFIEGEPATQQKVLNAAARFVERKGLSWKFSTRKEGNGFRVWRIK